MGESSVGSTNRRVEALVGIDAFRDLAAERTIVQELTSALKTPREQLPDRIAALMADLKSAERRIAQFEAAALGERVPALVANARRVGDVTVVAEHVGTLNSGDDLRGLVTGVRERLGSDPSVVALGADVAGKPAVIVGTNDAARARGVKAGVLAKGAAAVLGGGGGGKDDLAQGGGSDPSALPAALDGIVAAIGG